jgi:hypothetical protein
MGRLCVDACHAVLEAAAWVHLFLYLHSLLLSLPAPLLHIPLPHLVLLVPRDFILNGDDLLRYVGPAQHPRGGSW